MKLLIDFTESGPGVSASISADAAIAPSICAMQYSRNLTGRMTPTSNNARLTLGLKRPPVTRKNNHADTSKLSPIHVEMYMTCSTVDPLVVTSPAAAWIPPRPSRRKKVVPINSTRAAWASSRKVDNCDLGDMSNLDLLPVNALVTLRINMGMTLCCPVSKKNWFVEDSNGVVVCGE